MERAARAGSEERRFQLEAWQLLHEHFRWMWSQHPSPSEKIFNDLPTPGNLSKSVGAPLCTCEPLSRFNASLGKLSPSGSWRMFPVTPIFSQEVPQPKPVLAQPCLKDLPGLQHKVVWLETNSRHYFILFWLAELIFGQRLLAVKWWGAANS